MPPRIPDELKFGAVKFKVLTLGDGRFAFDYKPSPEVPRKVVKRSNFDDLRKAAETIATTILNAETAAQDLTADDRRIYVAARDLLEPQAIHVDQAARILVEAAGLVGGISRVVEACRWFGQSNQGVKTATVPEVIAHFIRNLRSDELDSEYVDQLEDDLEPFGKAFPGAMTMVTTNDIDGWLRGLGVGLRRRRNRRAGLVTLFNFAVEQGYLPENLKTAAERVKRPKVPRKAPALYTPDELVLFIQQCHQPPDKKSHRKDYREFLPVAFIAAFAGLRWAEIMALEWRHIHWEDGVIEVGEENKTGYRLVPILPNLMAFLVAYRGRQGNVCPYANRKQVNNAVRRIGMRAGLKVGDRKYANAFRHSYVTYRVAVTKNMPAVSTESGHSVAELRKSYNRASLEKVGLQWFDIKPETPENVTQMPLGIFASR